MSNPWGYILLLGLDAGLMQSRIRMSWNCIQNLIFLIKIYFVCFKKKNCKCSIILQLLTHHCFGVFLINYLFYFTALYWFCHPLTWICHGCTCVPHPEPPSHLPSRPIPLSHYYSWLSFLFFRKLCCQNLSRGLLLQFHLHMQKTWADLRLGLSVRPTSEPDRRSYHTASSKRTSVS